MTPRTSAQLLWLSLLICAPIPFFLVEIGRGPLAAIGQMLIVTIALLFTEGRGGTADMIVWILGIQILLALVGLGLLAVLATRLAFHVAGSRGSLVVAAVVAMLFVVALTQPIYRTPFRTAGLYATLAEVFE